MKVVFTILILFLFFFGMSMFGFYIEYDSFKAIDAQDFIQSCLIGMIGLIFSWLVSAVF